MSTQPPYGPDEEHLDELVYKFLNAELSLDTTAVVVGAIALTLTIATVAIGLHSKRKTNATWSRYIAALLGLNLAVTASSFAWAFLTVNQDDVLFDDVEHEVANHVTHRYEITEVKAMAEPEQYEQWVLQASSNVGHPAEVMVSTSNYDDLYFGLQPTPDGFELVRFKQSDHDIKPSQLEREGPLPKDRIAEEL